MHFKHPEILWFLFLLIIPILVHLFQLRRFKKELFTNVRFLKELSVQTRKSSKLKKYLLLATRLLLLAALIFAFAQPFFEAKDSKNATNEMYIVLDNSFSMQAKGQKGELMRRAVEDLLEHTPDNRSFSLVTNSETFWNTDIKSVRKDLQNLNYSPTAFSLESAMAKIKSRPSQTGRDIVIITDAVGLQASEAKSIGEANAYAIVPEAQQKNNVSADSVFVSQVLDNFYEIAVKLSAYGEDFGDVPIALYNREKLIAKTQLKFDAKAKTVNFTIPKDDFHGYVQISDNSLEYDNTLYFSISKPKKINVLAIGTSDKCAFLSRIYTPDEFIYAQFDLPSLDYNTIDKQDAIVLNELADIPQALQTTLKSFVEKGGNLVVIPSTETSLANLNNLLASWGNVKFNALRDGKKLVTKIAFGHPLYATVFEKKIDNFQYPEVKSSFAVNSGAAPVLAFDDQSAFLLALANPVSSVYVFTAPINKDNSNLQNSPLIVPTFYNMAATGGKTGISSITIGDDNPLVLDIALGRDEIVNIKGKSDAFIPVQQLLSGKVKLNFNGLPTVSGNYGVYKQTELQKEISFNYARTEGDLNSANPDVLAECKAVSSIDQVMDDMLSGRTDNELWKWFVILALLFLVLEILIQKFVK
ncbi:Aerotolerance regulator N-terminal domain-containing protein [Flavobacterium longum]|uniref:vWA domain-containing protein n=1 Tax=Flavobacterium longum TaxID=1299340 RepID=UPI0039E9B688